MSTTEQHLDRQTDTLRALGAERVFLEKISGAKTENRPALKRMLEYVRDGDVLIVESISRLARSTLDLLAIVDELRSKQVDLLSLKESVDTRTAQGRFVLSIFAALSELERETLLQRQREGIEAVRKRGKHLGRPAVKKPENWDRVYATWKSGVITAVEAMQRPNMSKPAFYRKVKRYGDAA